jgi:hypothetical protein
MTFPSSVGMSLTSLFSLTCGASSADVQEMDFYVAADQAHLNQGTFLEFPALIDPTAVLGAHLHLVPEARICLQHKSWTGCHYDPLGFFFGVFELGKGHFGAKDFLAFLVPFHRAYKICHGATDNRTTASFAENMLSYNG